MVIWLATDGSDCCLAWPSLALPTSPTFIASQALMNIYSMGIKRWGGAYLLHSLLTILISQNKLPYSFPSKTHIKIEMTTVQLTNILCSAIAHLQQSTEKETKLNSPELTPAELCTTLQAQPTSIEQSKCVISFFPPLPVCIASVQRNWINMRKCN